MQYIYFVSYQHLISVNIWGFGNTDVTTLGRIEDISDIREIEKKLEEKINRQTIVILNFQLLRVEEK